MVYTPPKKERPPCSCERTASDKAARTLQEEEAEINKKPADQNDGGRYFRVRSSPVFRLRFRRAQVPRPYCPETCPNNQAYSDIWSGFL